MDYNSNFDHRAGTKTILIHWKDSGEVQHRLYAPIKKLSPARHTKFSSKVIEYTYYCYLGPQHHHKETNFYLHRSLSLEPQ